MLTSGSLPVGGSYLVEIPTHCGVAVLGRKINDIFWTVTGSTQRGEDWMPVEWFESLSPGEEQLTVEMSLSDDEARLTLTAAGRTVTYRPMTADDPEFLCA